MNIERLIKAMIDKAIADHAKYLLGRHADHEHPHVHEAYTTSKHAEEIASTLLNDHIKNFRGYEPHGHTEYVTPRQVSEMLSAHRKDQHQEHDQEFAKTHRAGLLWSDYEDLALEGRLTRVLHDIAVKHGRTVSAIASRVTQKDLIARLI